MNNTVFEVIGMGAKKYGGFEKYIVEEARQLNVKGYKLVVVFDREPLAKSYIRDLMDLGVDINVIPQTSKIYFIKNFNQLLKKYKPEIVHTNFSSNIFFVMPLAIFYGVKRRIATEHCLPGYNKLKLRIAAQLASMLTNNILPVSKTSTLAKKKATWTGRRKIKTLYLGVEDKVYDKSIVRSEIGISDDTIALMNVAYHHPVKGVDVLLDAMSIIVNEHGIRNIVLYQIGGGQTGKDTEFLHEKAKSLGIENNVKWMGIRNDVPRLLCGGDIYIQPSRSEGIPLSIMEASIASLPIISTNVGGNPEAVIDGINGFLVPSEKPIEMASAILKLYSNSKIRQIFGQSGRKMAVNTFCLSNNVTRLLEEFYRI